MLDRPNTEHPGKRIPITSHELSRYKIGIAALSEVRFPENGCIGEEADFTIYWSGKLEKKNRREAGVALAVNNDLVSRLRKGPKPVNDRMTNSDCPRQMEGSVL